MMRGANRRRGSAAELLHLRGGVQDAHRHVIETAQCAAVRRTANRPNERFEDDDGPWRKHWQKTIDGFLAGSLRLTVTVLQLLRFIETCFWSLVTGTMIVLI
jgi:hypothetical protein